MLKLLAKKLHKTNHGGHQVFKVNFKGFQGIFQFSLEGKLANSRDFQGIFKGFSRDLSTERGSHWLEKFLKFTNLKWLKTHLNY